jgi:hypothetical protein
LRDEHIIPDSIGGRLIYEKASCHTCEETTHAFEGRIVSTAYGNTRALLGMKRGHRRKWPSEFQVEVRRGEETVKVPVSEEELPAANWIVNVLHAPPILENKPVLGDFVVDLALWSPLPDYYERLAKLGPGSVPVGPRFQFDEFFRFINKIAFSYAHAELRGRFAPLTADFVTSDRGKRIRRWIGGDIMGSTHKEIGDIHELHVAQVTDGDGLIYIAVRVHLFTLNEFPAYVVIVGTANELTAQPEGTSYAATEPSRMFGRSSGRTRKAPPNWRVRFRPG